MTTASEKVVISGAGLCGSLLAICLAERGYSVELFEKRPDLRKVELDAGRSINLALSDRGLKALAMVGLEQAARDISIPMYGRRIHGQDGKTELFRYSGREADYINSISRPGLNALLLDKAESLENVKLHFDMGCSSIDWKSKNSIFINAEGEKVNVGFDVIFGTDGAGSAVRKSVAKAANEIRFDFSQKFLSTGYKELTIPPSKDGGHLIDKHALHIWPRDGFMMIALPNLDGSFTVTLFLPFEGKHGFDAINSDEAIEAMFEENFSDALVHMPDIIKDYKGNPTSSLGTIRCYPWQVDGKLLLMGDAAHAIVPFYGQGMNCAFEDSTVLCEVIDTGDGNWDRIFKEYQERRKPSTDAIADLAEDNFYEMRDDTADRIFNFKRQIELKMEQEYPDYYSKYSLVSFRDNLPYEEAMDLGRVQDQILMKMARKYIDQGPPEMSVIYKEFTDALEKVSND